MFRIIAGDDLVGLSIYDTNNHPLVNRVHPGRLVAGPQPKYKIAVTLARAGNLLHYNRLLVLEPICPRQLVSVIPLVGMNVCQIRLRVQGSGH